jgi:hypothetical protein
MIEGGTGTEAMLHRFVVEERMAMSALIQLVLHHQPLIAEGFGELSVSGARTKFMDYLP